MVMVERYLSKILNKERFHMCCNMKRSSSMTMAMMGMGMAMMAGMMMGSCLNNRMNSNKKSMRRFGMMKKSDESDLQKA